MSEESIVFVKQLDGSTAKISYSAKMTVATLRGVIEQQTNIPQGCQRLVYRGQEIEESQGHLSLAQLNIVPKCSIYLINLFGSVFEEKVHFCIDVSLSMDNKFVIGNKLFSRLNCVKQELKRMISNFQEDKQINLYAFGSSVSLWSKTIKYCTKENKDSAIQWVDRLDPMGSTALAEALETVISCDINAKTIYVLSDGSPNSEHKVMEWVAKNPNVMVHTTNFMGDTILASFLQELSSKTGGTYRSFSPEQLFNPQT
uniref:Ubiquitin-like domain-containing protein n=1 Tax=Arcella intermedia TaxID=1963864 RepID=A0A6B2LFD6_9EUKA